MGSIASYVKQGSSQTRSGLQVKGNEKECETNAQLSEAGLWTHWHHIGDFYAVFASGMFTLSPERFHQVVSSYARLMTFCKAHANLFAEGLHAQTTIERSDEFNSTELLTNFVFNAGGLRKAVTLAEGSLRLEVGDDSSRS